MNVFLCNSARILMKTSCCDDMHQWAGHTWNCLMHNDQIIPLDLGNEILFYRKEN